MKSLVASALTILLSACSQWPALHSAPAPAPLAPKPVLETLAPNANLFVQGIPPIPLSLVQQVSRYTDFRGHNFVDWHPSRREMLVSYRKAGGNTVQLFRLRGPMAEPEPLTDFADPVRTASYEPLQGNYLVFERSSGGNRE